MLQKKEQSLGKPLHKAPSQTRSSQDYLLMQHFTYSKTKYQLVWYKGVQSHDSISLEEHPIFTAPAFTLPLPLQF